MRLEANPSKPSSTAHHTAEVTPRSPSVIQKFFYLLGARWLREIVQAFFFIYLARHSDSVFGEFMLGMALGSILLIATEFGLNQLMVPLFTGQAGDSSVLSRVLGLKALLFGSSWCLCIGFIIWQDYSAQLAWVAGIVATGTGMEALSNTFFVNMQVLGRQELEGKIRSLGAIVAFTFGSMGIWMGWSPILIACFKMLESLVNSTAAIWTTAGWKHFATPEFSAASGLRLFPAAAVFGLIEIVAVLYNRLNLFFLHNWGGAAGVAQYSVAWQVVDGVSSLVSVLLLQSVLYPVFAKLWREDRLQVRALAEKSLCWLMSLGLLVMAGLVTISDRLILLLYGPGYQDAVWVLKLTAVLAPCAFLHNLAAFLMMSAGRQKRLLLYCILGLAANVGLCAGLIPGNPLLGAGVSIVLAKLLVMGLSFADVQRLLQLVQRGWLLRVALAGLAAGGVFVLIPGPVGRTLSFVLSASPAVGMLWKNRELRAR